MKTGRRRWSNALKVLKERKKVNVSLGPSDVLQQAGAQLEPGRGGGVARSRTPIAARRSQRGSKEAPKGNAGAMSTQGHFQGVMTGRRPRSGMTDQGESSRPLRHSLARLTRWRRILGRSRHSETHFLGRSRCPPPHRPDPASPRPRPARRSLRRLGGAAPEVMPGLPPAPRRAHLRVVPQTGCTTPGGPARLARRRSARRRGGRRRARGRREIADTARDRQRSPRSWPRTRIRGPPRAGARRHGRRLPGAQHADGPAGGAQGAEQEMLDRSGFGSGSSARSARRPARPPQHRHRLLGVAGRRPLVFAMEYVEGYDLASWSRRGPLPVAHACQLHLPGGAGSAARSRAGDGASRHQAPAT